MSEMLAHSGTTRDGFSWTSSNGMKKGNFTSKGVISPSERIRSPGDFVYDTIVVGAGYAGLSSARDLTNAGRKVLLLEGRDRVGGRTFTIKEDGFNYEMGGTWVSHCQPHTFRELLRYNMDKDLIKTRESGHANDYYTFALSDAPARHVSHEEAAASAAKGWNLFINVDGAYGRKICPLPHQQLENVQVDRKEVEKWDSYSCWDRFEEMKSQLNKEESDLLLSLLLMISGGNLHNSSLWDMIRSQALVNHEFNNFEDIWFLYKLREGQSALARNIFNDAVSNGLEYAFQTPVSGIKQVSNNLNHVSTRDGRIYQARKVICAVPLNILKHLNFEPSLSPLRQEAVEAGHINYMTKIHAVVKGSGMASWNGVCYPNNILYAYGDGVLPSGDAHLVCFGTDERPHFVPERDPAKILSALQNFHPMEVKKLVFHNWNTDPYSQAGPCFWPPGFMTKYQEELQSRHKNVFFASADWANGWRAFIDGALEQGFLNAQNVLNELRQEDKATLPGARSSL
ncbi:hypothetical protein N7456_002608 [Penicillium angulare]|uniref:Amine oxidase n=1 Tax=Penicillium angulare TaxID=116970 RepID=A0A9W9KP60_9EURO|nr:hypothetical protein N7456_002608 [Penicillium angulare]